MDENLLLTAYKVQNCLGKYSLLYAYLQTGFTCILMWTTARHICYLPNWHCPGTGRTAWHSGTTFTGDLRRPCSGCTSSENRRIPAPSGAGDIPRAMSGWGGRWRCGLMSPSRSSSPPSSITASVGSPWTTSVSWREPAEEVSERVMLNSRPLLIN